MDAQEIASEVLADWQSASGTIERLAQTYDKERRRQKIGRELAFSKSYDIKTKKKNTWIFILSKAPADEKYKGLQSINVLSLVYYYSPLGLRVIKIMPGGGLSVFNSHLFTRYKERLNLDIIKPLDLVKYFFINNGYFMAKVIPKDGRQFVLSVCNEGLLLGEMQAAFWMVYKTFLTRELIKQDQTEAEAELMADLQADIQAELSRTNFDKDSYFYKADILKGIRP